MGNMGKQALISHAKGKKHKDKMLLMAKVKSEQSTLSGFLKKDENEKSSQDAVLKTDNLTIPPPPEQQQQAGPSSVEKQSTTKGNLSSWLSKEDTLKAETLWAMKSLISNYSANSCQGNNELFAAMFPDSATAKQFQCGKTKCSYLISYGIAPYYHDILLKQLQTPGT